MKIQSSKIIAVCLFFVLFAAGGVCFGVETSDINRVRNKAVLESGDFAVIDGFVQQAVSELVDTADFSNISKIRTIIVSRRNSSVESANAQYQQQFNDSAFKYISQAFKGAAGLADPEAGTKIELNLLILLHDLGNARLSKLALDYVNNESTLLNYWAVKTVCSEAIIKEINEQGGIGSGFAIEVTNKLNEVVLKSFKPEVVSQMVGFALGVQIPQGQTLFNNIIDSRLKQYEKWDVDMELLDAKLLSALNEKVSQEPALGGNANGDKFGQLFSYVIQRYIKGQEFLSEKHKCQLESVMIDVEQEIISERLGLRQSVLKRGIEAGDMQALQAEHDRLLGNGGSGKLSGAMGFDFGGKGKPALLPEPRK